MNIDRKTFKLIVSGLVTEAIVFGAKEESAEALKNQFEVILSTIMTVVEGD